VGKLERIERKKRKKGPVIGRYSIISGRGKLKHVTARRDEKERKPSRRNYWGRATETRPIRAVSIENVGAKKEERRKEKTERKGNRCSKKP